MKTIQDPEMLETYLTKCSLPSLFSDFGRYRNHLSLVLFEKGEHIYAQKSDISYLYFFVEGKLKVCSNMSNGKSHLLHFYTAFELLGDLELFNRSNPYVTIQTVSDSLCISLALRDTRSFLLQDPVFLRYLCETVCAKLYISSSNDALSLFCPLENRLASYINVAGEYRVSGGRRRLVLDENLTDLAELLETSYRHLQRTLKTFTQEGILRRSKQRCYEVIDLPRLQALATDAYLVPAPPVVES